MLVIVEFSIGLYSIFYILKENNEQVLRRFRNVAIGVIICGVLKMLLNVFS